MLDCLKTNDLSRKWQCFNEERFQLLLNSPEEILKQLTKQELKLCFEVINEVLVGQNIHVGNLWPKYKLCHLLYCLVSGLTFLESDCSNYINQKKSSKVEVFMCKHSKLPKHILACIYAEHIRPTKKQIWPKNMLFLDGTTFSGLNSNYK